MNYRWTKEKEDFLVRNYASSSWEYLFSSSEYINDARCGGKIVDWVVCDSIFVEYFGMAEKEEYNKKMMSKIEICNDNNVSLICLYRKHLTKLHLVFSDFL
jgi:hypothetical protein